MSRGYRGMISIYKVNDIPLIGSIVNSGLLHLSSWSSLCLCLKGPKHSGVQTPTQSFLQVHLYEHEGRRGEGKVGREYGKCRRQQAEMDAGEL